SPLIAIRGATPLNPTAAIAITASNPLLVTMHLLRLGLGSFAWCIPSETDLAHSTDRGRQVVSKGFTVFPRYY
ncbi:MAG TPA: hypothetical protein VLL94_13800, partial [Nitrospiraceae bacterium]|nr:hypothetical protein [Nitrospiraceae bacterium]